MNRSAIIHSPVLRALFLAAIALLPMSGCGTERTTAVPTTTAAPSIIRVKIGPDATEQVVSVSGPFQVYDPATRSRLMSHSSMTRGVFTATAEGLRLNGQPINSKVVEIVPRNPASIQVLSADSQGRLMPSGYRGNMRVIGQGQTVRLVNVVNIDEYLYSVVGKETYSVRWHIESQKAQAIAARSYALVEARSASSERDFDVFDSPGRSQAYPGISSETDRSRQASDETRGIVISHVEKGQTRILHAFYSSTCGGKTVPAETFFNVPASAPLAGVECTWCRDTRNYEWKATISQADLRRGLAPLVPQQMRLDEVVAFSIPPEARNADGSAKAVVVTFMSQGRRESMGIKAERLRSALGTTTVKSTWISSITMAAGQATIEGRGFGHRVGMCQFGAEEQAKAGRNAGQILQLYYPTSRLTRVY